MNSDPTITSSRRRLAEFAIIWFAISLPFVIIHLFAASNHPPITPLQHRVAALANFLGPWGVAIVRLVDFPNAGLRSFSLALALGLTMVGGLLLFLTLRINNRPLLLLFTVLWGLFSLVWFIVGLRQIADGLL